MSARLRSRSLGLLRRVRRPVAEAPRRPGLPTRHHSVVVATEVEHHGQAGSSEAGPTRPLAAVRHRLEVTDHGTGLGRRVVDTVGLPDEAAARSYAGWPTTAGEQWDVDLHPFADGQMVNVVADWAGPPTQHRPADVADAILARITRRLLDLGTGAPRLHGGATAGNDGRAVLILGASGAGKSTLTIHLASQNTMRLLNDEQITVFAPHEQIGGFTRPVAIKRPGLAFLPDGVPNDGGSAQVHLISASQLNAQHVLAATPALVVVPERDDAVRDVSWALVHPGEAVVELCSHNLDLVRGPKAGLDAYGWLAATVPMVRLRYRDAADAVPVVLALLAAPPASPMLTWTVVDPAERGDAHPARVPTLDASPEVLRLVVGDELVLFHQRTRQVAHLNATAAALWASLPWEDLQDGIEDRRDGDGDPSRLVADLVAKGFLIHTAAVNGQPTDPAPT